MSYIITKPIKSKGIAALLVMIFGGLGLFYASIWGGIIMSFVAPVLIWVFFFWGALSGSVGIMAIVIIFCCFYYIICLIWALVSVGNYNKKIIAQSYLSQEYNYEQISSNRKSNIGLWILGVMLVMSIFFLLLHKESKLTNDVNELKDKKSNSDAQIKGKQQLQSSQQNNKTKTRQEEFTINKKIFGDKNAYTWVTTGYYDIDLKNKYQGKYISEKKQRYFIEDDNKTFMILDGDIVKVWHHKKDYFEDELHIIETKEGDEFAEEFETIEITNKEGKGIHYECETVQFKDLKIKPHYLK